MTVIGRATSTTVGSKHRAPVSGKVCLGAENC
jgi:hypothetical protein